MKRAIGYTPAGGIVMCLIMVVFGSAPAQGQPAPPATPKFEVASVRECVDHGPVVSTKSSPGRLSLTCWPIRRIIEGALEVFADGKVDPHNPSYPLTPIEGGPDWMNSAKYTIDAKTAGPQSVAMMRGPIMRELLQDRFRLQAHHETRETPVYIMTVARDGPKLQPTKEGSCNDLDTTDPTQSLKLQPGARPWCVITPPTNNGTHWVWDVKGMSMDVFTTLIKVGGVPVIDRTALKGIFDIHLEWDFIRPDELPPDVGVASDPPDTSIASAIRKQLGLELRRGKGPREFIVIDHLERPSSN